MALFDLLEYWHDEVPRRGVENMAVDQLLLEGLGGNPVLRIYGWNEPTVSFGYFHTLQDARAAFPSTTDRPLTYVRRWTGGGIVDHRVDLTYTLVVPRDHTLSRQRGPDSYRLIHQILHDVLNKLGEQTRLLADADADGPVCFANPVAYDLTDARGIKIAGAGQRRTRYGLLHQGSLVSKVDAGLVGAELAAGLAAHVREWLPSESFQRDVAALAARRYASEKWLTGS